MSNEEWLETVETLRSITSLWTEAMGRSEVELNTLRVFLTVAAAGGRPIQQSAVRDGIGLSEAATSRNIQMLSSGATPTSKAPELIESYEDPQYRRRKLVRLTSRGEDLLREMHVLLAVDRAMKSSEGSESHVESRVKAVS